ncbi:ADP-ribosylglycohydrolase family protein [Haloarcula onubensis]|uniref:ADP-ribosylglycohydrolase family protein n=1 Tax=Haloarcula onubensis TaxID=2950539 RepID=A0ABU2FUG9_9EURY|nr:ADP-ribosylglycohydrolase family protein [Halomicroarcula sp. S3CR25-11]MDS0284074.1 ADP-ribosylglycohydrolase family protein [Halomicroarcula sp. S3CR25-11]
MDSVDPATGVLLGLACGDALGRPVEFRSARQITEQHDTLTDMVGHGTHGKPAGTITDDTDLALCIARSLAEQASFDGEDIADRFAAWYDEGPFDVGLMTADAISEYQTGTSWRDAGREVWQRRAEGSNAGNGSIMRCAPHAIAFADDPDSLERVSKQSSAITHYDPRCQYGCVLLNHIIAGYLNGNDEPLTDAIERVEGEAPDELVETIRLVPDLVDEGQLQNTGYVIHTLQTSLYDALTADTAEEAIVASVNRGGDTDTLGAVTGALAGARFGADALPDRWLETLEYRDDLQLLAQALATTDVDATV